MKGVYWCGVMVSTTMWVKPTFKSLILQACRIFFVGLELLVLGGDPVSCRDLGANVLHVLYDAQFAWGFFLFSLSTK